MRLKTLSIDHLSLIRDTRDASVDGLLFDPGLAPSTVESLRIIREHRPDTFAHHSHWTQLRSLVLQLSSYMPEVIAKAIKLLRNIQGPVLRKVSIEFGPVSSVLGTIRDLQRTGQFQPSIYTELERALLRFSEPGIIWTTVSPLRADRNTFWAGELGKHFPSLSKRGAMTIKSEIVTPVGHDATLQALVASPHSKWVASGSEDSTVILWDPDGNIAQQWLTDAHESVWSLAFSPDGRYLVSGDGAGKMEIRDLSQGGSKAATLEGHTSAVSSCAWSPRGDTVASGSFDASVRLWDAHTFEQLHELRAPPMKGMQYVAFSPDGRWLASWAFPCHYAIWDVTAGALHKLIEPAEFGTIRMLDIAAAFDPSSTRLATISRHETVEIWDVEAGRRERVLRRVGEANDVAFSPDGGMLLVASGDRTVRLWDAREGVEMRRLKGHTSIVSNACFSACGKYVASASWDETVRVWRTGNGSCVATFADHGHLVTHVAFSPDGRTLASGARNGTVIIRHMCDIIPKDEQDSDT
ncbi:transporter [Ganoderma sinense ZZ0214-1]|uniref:Transporter n=1 Tax=Ganoderma sinense ZZ0214-1 TaxID=1077348 RepID=A0A2G8SQF7_9APHY|nr:transporter [Ganoderma sinense ZZ0214-1]